MSLRASEHHHGTSLLHTRPKGLPIGTTGPLYSDAIRLRKGVTISGTTTPPTFVDAGRRSFQEPFVPRRAPSPLVPNGGLDIEALVAKAKTNLCVCNDDLETDATMRERAEQVKKWYAKKKAQVLEKLTKKKKDKCDNPKTPLDEIRCDIEKEKEEEANLTEEQKQEKARQQLLDAGIVTKMIFADPRMREALEDLGLVHVTTGKHLELHELTSEELEMALDLADVDLDSEAE